jgi:transcriptional regulator with XRE-family HTH domain
MSRDFIARKSGVNKHWLEKFDQGVIANPTIDRIERLRDWLIANPCEDQAAA